MISVPAAEESNDLNGPLLGKRGRALDLEQEVEINDIEGGESEFTNSMVLYNLNKVSRKR